MDEFIRDMVKGADHQAGYVIAKQKGDIEQAERDYLAWMEIWRSHDHFVAALLCNAGGNGEKFLEWVLEYFEGDRARHDKLTSAVMATMTMAKLRSFTAPKDTGDRSPTPVEVDYEDILADLAPSQREPFKVLADRFGKPVPISTVWPDIMTKNIGDSALRRRRTEMNSVTKRHGLKVRLELTSGAREVTLKEK